MIIKEVLKLAVDKLKLNNIEDASIKAKILLAEVLGKEKEYLLIHDQEEIKDNDMLIFMSWIERLEKEEPLQYILNKQEFMGLQFFVDENVLIPQPDTENLVEEVIMLSENIKTENDKIKILDMCTGSGAIAISLAKYLKKSLVYASDISIEALKIAEENATRNLTSVVFFESDMFNNISSEFQFDIIVSNPPYIETEIVKTLSKEVQAEPIIALDGGEDGLKFYREIIKNAKDYLKVDGYLAFEIGYNQKHSVMDLLKENGYKNVYSKKDLSGNDRVVIGQK